MKTILLTDFSLVVNGMGGAERVLCNMANFLCDAGYGVVVVCSEKKEGKTFYELNGRVKFYNIGVDVEPNIVFKVIRKVLRRFKIDYGYIFNKDSIKNKLKNIIILEKPDIIINSFPIHLSYINAVKGNIPVIQMLHSSSAWLKNEIIKDSTILTELKKINVLQVLLPSYKADLINLGLNKLVCIPNAVKQEQVTSNYNSNVIYLSRYDQDKQIHLLIDSFALVVKKNPNWKLYVYGDIWPWSKDYKKKLREKIANYGIEASVFLGSRIDNPVCFLMNASICAFPSKFEGFPLALAEAMSIGLPCIGYKSCSGVNELIVNGENGFLVEDGVREFADKLEFLMKNKEEVVKMGKKGKDLIKSYDYKIVYQRWIDLIEWVGVNANKRNS